MPSPAFVKRLKDVWRSPTFKGMIGGGAVALGGDLLVGGSAAATANYISKQRDKKLTSRIASLERRVRGGSLPQVRRGR